ncbi:MAG: hypothetical protein HQL37_09070 [Alphaproteobacteria bacterium]|nr:hypothetical protein [Alphaproteobacteria bacterium]
MQDELEKEIAHQAEKLVRRAEVQRWAERKDRERYEKRTGETGLEKAPYTPISWGLHDHFDPKYCMRHRKFLARVLWSKILDGAYKPQPALVSEIKKATGGTRKVMTFTTPDTAIASLFHRRMTKRNVNRLSASSYAFRFDRNIFDAILSICEAIDRGGVFVVRYDFRSYFDNIDHRYLLDVLLNRCLFTISRAEEGIIRAFLKHSFAAREDYQAGKFEQRDIGVPQGNSLSLFLSNVAAHDLDIALETRNGRFARFADDLLAITHTLDEAREISAAVQMYCLRSGARTNPAKPHGIYRLAFEPGPFDPPLPETMDHVPKIDKVNFLGHSLHSIGVTLPNKTVSMIKRRMSKCIYIHLLHNPRSRKLFNRARVGAGFFDWDFVTCLNELRRMIYGDITEGEILTFLDGKAKLRRPEKMMRNLPMITDPAPLIALDGWLVSVLHRALKERERVLAKNFAIETYTAPSERSIITGDWFVFPEMQGEIEPRCPSFVRGWRAARKYYYAFGTRGLSPPAYSYSGRDD